MEVNLLVESTSTQPSAGIPLPIEEQVFELYQSKLVFGEAAIYNMPTRKRAKYLAISRAFNIEKQKKTTT